MTFARPLGGIVAALCLCLTVASSAAPRKATKHHAAPVRHSRPATVAPLPVKTPAVDLPAATPTPGDEEIYNGRPAAAAGLTLAAFGGGGGEDSTEQSFAKGHSLKITTLDAYQGATLTFGTPVALGDLADKTRFLAITLRLTPAAGNFVPQMAGPGGPGMPGPGMPGPGMPGPGFPGGLGQGPGGYESGGQFAVAAAPVVQNIHLILTLANGTKTDMLRPLPSTGEAQSGVDQWITVATPLSALGIPTEVSSPLQSITIAGDEYAVMYVGQIKIARDDTPLTCFAGDQQTVAVGQPFVLKGTAGGGLSTLHYAWTLDDAIGTTEQASGPVITTQYLKAGDHTVTLTVSDLDGIKKPVSATTVIHVQ